MRSEVLPNPDKSMSLFALPGGVVILSVLSAPFVDNVYPMAALFFSIYVLARRTFEAILVSHKLTSTGVREQRGALYPQEREINYNDIDSIKLKQSRIQTLFDSGTVIIEAAGTLPILIKHTNNHIAIKHAIDGLVQRHKELRIFPREPANSAKVSD